MHSNSSPSLPQHNTPAEASAFKRAESAPLRASAAERCHYVALGVGLSLGGQLAYIKRTDSLYALGPSGLYERLDTDTLERCVAGQWGRDFYNNAAAAWTPSNLSDTIKVLKTLTPTVLEEVSWRYFMAGQNTYWDMELGKPVRVPDSPVYHRFFDTPKPTKHIPAIPEFTPEQEAHLWERYEETLGEMERGEFPERYDFIKVWANNSHDVYMDMMRAFAYCLVPKKPVGAYILIGNKRNGKSSFIGLVHTIFGTANTSKVQMAQLGDPHFTHSLLSTMANAPDEEEDTALQSQATFKTLCDHGTLDLPVMRSNEPVELNCDFMSFFPMNHIPEFKGSGASACLERCLVLPFNNDLSKYDKASKNFAEETFTPDLLADFMGTVFGLATWYSSHDLEFSETMLNERAVLEEDQDSALMYRQTFEKYFDGFDSFKTLYDDYNLWCQANEIKIKTLKEFKFIFREYRANRMSVRVGGKYTKCYRVPQPDRLLYTDDSRLPEMGYIKDMRESKNCSVIERLETYYGDKLEEFYGFKF